MIVKIHKAGRSFKGAGAYLTHDPKAETAQRAAWTHTLDLANDHVLSAIDEMYRTAENAELLKAEAGVHGGGRSTERPAKHVSLSWSPDESPTREQMIAASEEYLEHMNWSGHQTIIVAHDDKAYDHVHLLINAIHPETGKKLNEDFEQRRSQQWALDYELRNGRVLCENRLENAAGREDGPTRPAWMAFQDRQREFERVESNRRKFGDDFSREPENPENPRAAEWRQLRAIQRETRESWFAHGRLEFRELRNSIYREVREEFREDWRDYFFDLKNGGDPKDLAERKAELIAGQKMIIEERRDEACKELLKTRKEGYEELLALQRDERVGLYARQNAGFETGPYLEWVAAGRPSEIRDDFREAAKEVTLPREPGEWKPARAAVGWRREDSGSRMRGGFEAGARVGEGVGFALISLAESLFDGFIGAKPDPAAMRREPPAPPPGPDPFEAAVRDARERQAREREDDDEKWRARQRGSGGG